MNLLSQGAKNANLVLTFLAGEKTEGPGRGCLDKKLEELNCSGRSHAFGFAQEASEGRLGPASLTPPTYRGGRGAALAEALLQLIEESGILP